MSALKGVGSDATENENTRYSVVFLSEGPPSAIILTILIMMMIRHGLRTQAYTVTTTRALPLQPRKIGIPSDLLGRPADMKA
jgi:hypothetical protein